MRARILAAQVTLGGVDRHGLAAPAGFDANFCAIGIAAFKPVCLAAPDTWWSASS